MNRIPRTGMKNMSTTKKQIFVENRPFTWVEPGMESTGILLEKMIMENSAASEDCCLEQLTC